MIQRGMKVEDFQTALAENGGYRTPVAVRSRGWWVGRFDWAFYLAMNAVFIRAGCRARFSRYDDRQWSLSSCRLLRLYERAGARIEVEGLDNLAAAGGPAVVVSNHMSLAETVLTPVLMLPFGRLSIVVKESLLRYPFFGDVLRSVNPISVTRANARADLKTVLTEGAAALEAGRSVLIFPQATRNPVLHTSRFNSLGAKLAARAGRPVVPLALKTDFQGTGRWIKDFGRLDRSKPMHFSFGAPLQAAGREKETHRAVTDFIADRLTAWGGEVRREAEATASLKRNSDDT